jgi:hypothetical protein
MANQENGKWLTNDADSIDAQIVGSRSASHSGCLTGSWQASAERNSGSDLLSPQIADLTGQASDASARVFSAVWLARHGYLPQRGEEQQPLALSRDLSLSRSFRFTSSAKRLKGREQISDYACGVCGIIPQYCKGGDSDLPDGQAQFLLYRKI